MAPVPAAPVMLRAEEVSREQPSPDAPVAELVEGINRFGYQLAPSAADKNWVASPVSIAFALAMIRAGAEGDTAAEIDRTFAFPDRVHEACNALSRQLVTASLPPARGGDRETRELGSPPEPTIVSVGNALFPAKTFEIRQAFLRTLAEQYGAGVYPVDFRQAQATEDIDAWARLQTADRIKKVFDELDPATAMVLANTVYLKGEWVTPFDENYTVDSAFHLAGGRDVTVPMMQHVMTVGYASGDGWKAVELPYGDGTFAMRILLPTGAKTPYDVLAPGLLDRDTRNDRTMSTQRVQIKLPRWDFAADVELKGELIRLDLPSLFDPDKADLSGVSPSGLYVDAATHKATVTVDEYGSEAAAITASAYILTSAPDEPKLTLHADRPFAFAIVHLPTGAPLFIG